jgi:hypothetical protein
MEGHTKVLGILWIIYGVVAVLNVIWFPFGTALSIYTFVILLNTETIALFKKG